VSFSITNREFSTRVCAAAAIFAALAFVVPLHAHNGPPFPLITDRTAGRYVVSLWADPDASDDGDADGQFWVLVNPLTKGTTIPADTIVQISIWPVGQPEAIRMQPAVFDEQVPSRRTASFVIDREGRYGVKATIDGPLGPAEIQAVVDAEYGTRPRRALIAVFALPFVLIGFVWMKLLLKRRAFRASGQGLGVGGSGLGTRD
jgi:hypothetical protein